MKRKLTLTVMSALLLMLGACGDKKTAQSSDNASQTKEIATNKDDAAIKTETETDDAEQAANASQDGGIAGIRKSWEKQPLTNVLSNGKPNVAAFATAFCKSYPDYEPNNRLYNYVKNGKKDELYGIDDQAKNGYLSCKIRAENPYETTCCYWKRSNGHSLVAFWLELQRENDDIDQHLLAFYDYDPATNTMTPEPAITKMVDDAMAKYDTYSVLLPSQGKDVEVYGYKIDYENDMAETTEYRLQWNGNNFRIEKVAEEE